MTTNKWEKIGENLYSRSGSIYHRSQVDGKRVWIRLQAKTIKAAKLELSGKLREATQQGELTIKGVLEFYRQHNCPKRNEQPRSGRQLSMEVVRIRTLSQKLGTIPVSQLNHGTLRDYREWRGQTRACELDIVTLASACRWAYRNPAQTGLLHNPMPMDRPRFAPTKQHCRDRQPSNAEELHLIAQTMMDNGRTAVFGWMALFLAFTGIRIGRARMFRLDASKHDPGHYDGECIWVGISQTHKGVFPFIKMHEALRQWWKAYHQWRESSGINSPWYFPSSKNPSKPVGRDSLVHAMRQACETLGIPMRSPHGLRSYFVNVLRSQGIMDAEIALQIGHRSGGKLIVEVYGEVLPHPISFLPEEGSVIGQSVTTCATTSP